MTEAAAAAPAPQAQPATQQNNALSTALQTAPLAGLQPDFVEWGKTKGYGDGDLQRVASDPVGLKILTSYREAERHLGTLQGADKVILPKGEDKAAWDAVYTKLGRPATPSGYAFEMPQGADHGFALTAGNWFHEAGLSQKQAGILNKQWNTYVQAAVQRDSQELSQRASAEVAGVTRDWGPNAKLNAEIAARGLNLMGRELGLEPSRVEAIKNSDQVVLSAGEALKLFRLVGELGRTTSDTFEGAGTGNRGQGLAMTPGEAQARLNQLQNDRGFYERLQRGDASAMRERSELFRIIGRAG
jgi:hypothetical protein